jgi:plastocyanin domain-containing protein
MSRHVGWAVALVAIAGCAGSGSGKSEVRVTVTENGFEPAIVTVAKGSTATLVITRTTDATCATEAVFAETGAKYPLPLNQAVRIPIATATAETLHYACGMDMYQGRVAVK